MRCSPTALARLQGRNLLDLVVIVAGDAHIDLSEAALNQLRPAAAVASWLLSRMADELNPRGWCCNRLVVLLLPGCCPAFALERRKGFWLLLAFGEGERSGGGSLGGDD